MGTPDNIKTFCSYLERQVRAVRAIHLDASSLQGVDPIDFDLFLCKKTLLLTILDAMAGIRFSKKHYPDLHGKNQGRFTRFIRDYANWEVGELISIPYLDERLLGSAHAKSALAEHVKERLSRFNTRAGVPLDAAKIDEKPEALRSFVKTESEEKHILECKHYSILYRYRNHLIHEAREPGDTTNFLTGTDAHYQAYINDPESKWYLAYPLPLLERLCNSCISGLREYLLGAHIDPYSWDVLTDTSRF